MFSMLNFEFEMKRYVFLKHTVKNYGNDHWIEFIITFSYLAILHFYLSFIHIHQSLYFYYRFM